VSDPLFTVVTGKFRFQIRFEDVPGQYILGGRCFCCNHRGPVDRHRIERKWGAVTQMRWVEHHLRCLVCGNRSENSFTVVGTYLPEPRLAEVTQLAAGRAA
jgi:hypothetical protein